MKQNDGVKNDEFRSDYQIFKKYPVKTKRKKVDLEQLYVVPWELMEDDTKRWTLNH